jgi:molybdopterin-guanine dinucleotide biosynthesis protein A
MPPLELSGAVLAGGHSRRMGHDKACLPFRGTPLIEHQVTTLRAAGCAEVFISGRADRAYPVPGTRFVADEQIDAGPLAGLATVLAAAQHPWVLVVAVDLPFITPAFLSGLVFKSGGLVGVVPHRAGEGYEPLAALYPRRFAAVARAALHQGERRIQPLIERAERMGQLVRLPLTDEMIPLLSNWNTPEDILASKST